jgi:hypothetical protein
MNKKQNPSVVIDSVLEDETTFGKITIHPVTIWKYALLEKIQSPFLFPDTEFTLENIAPTVFILAKERNELKPYVKDVDKLKEDSMDWLDDNLDLSDMPKMIQKIVEEFTKLNNAAPTQTGADDGKKS